jgi:uncharacterized protein (DUF983 family)
MPKYISNRFAAFTAGKCPRCQTGQLFTKSILSKDFQKVRSHCPHCGIKFESEPGFFWGAMYFSYALVVGWSIFLGIVFYQIYQEPPLFLTSAVIVGSIILLTPFYARLSRMLMVYIAAPYRKFDANFVEKTEAPE